MNIAVQPVQVVFASRLFLNENRLNGRQYHWVSLLSSSFVLAFHPSHVVLKGRLQSDDVAVPQWVSAQNQTLGIDKLF